MTTKTTTLTKTRQIVIRAYLVSVVSFVVNS